MRRHGWTTTSVFIVGGGPVGLAMGLLLHRFGIRCVVVERSEGTTTHPKSRGCFVRSMELFRQWGVEAPIRDARFAAACRRLGLREDLCRRGAGTHDA